MADGGWPDGGWRALKGHHMPAQGNALGFNPPNH